MVATGTVQRLALQVITGLQNGVRTTVAVETNLAQGTTAEWMLTGARRHLTIASLTHLPR